MKTPQEVKDQSGNCYFLEEGQYNDILTRRHDPDFVLYPERSLNIRELSTKWLPPSGQDVVTENPWVVSSYDKTNVFILIDGQWKHPEEQTFGRSVEQLVDVLFNINSSIPRLPITMLKGLLGVEHKI